MELIMVTVRDALLLVVLVAQALVVLSRKAEVSGDD
jgi:hypothetical protein